MFVVGTTVFFKVLHDNWRGVGSGCNGWWGNEGVLEVLHG